MDKRILALTSIVVLLCVGILSEIFPDLFQVRPIEYTAVHLTQAPAISVPNFEKVVYASAPAPTEDMESVDTSLSRYLEVTASCGAYFESECVNVRTGPSTSSPAILKLRNGVVLKIKETVENEGRTWHKIIFDEWIRYPERVRTEWYVAGDFVTTFYNEGIKELTKDEPHATSTKKIIVDRSEQMLYAYEGEVLFMQQVISTGLDLTPTPRGLFTVYKKTPSRYMQGPLPGISDKYYDLPGVPWNLYFTYEGAIIHGAYWHASFGKQWSNGCVNVPLDKARELYLWAELGTSVLVRD